ncbi:MAG TPA: hypothetical protein VL947_05495 [Cytophagales bacterium]|nr:hypothetical protein [Cytophagales bacterium]
MVKKLVLTSKISKYLQDKHPVRKSIEYSNVRNIGVIINMQDLTDVSEIDRLKTQLSTEHSNIQVIAYVTDTKKLPDYFILKNIHYFSSKDISTTGKILAKKLQDFVDKEFDILYVVNSKTNNYIDYVSSLSKANFRMGLYQKDRKDMYELSIELEKYSTDLLISQLRTYSKIIS